MYKLVYLYDVPSPYLMGCLNLLYLSILLPLFEINMLEQITLIRANIKHFAIYKTNQIKPITSVQI